uniref:Uncharacterized protein n=2 Tax=Gadus morhua TaxID=8049 RepID=A0A8C5CIW8_GADMO
MGSARLFSVTAWLVPLAAGLLLVSMATGLEVTTHPAGSFPAPGTNSTNSSAVPPPHRGPPPPRGLNVDNMVVQRALYVLIGFTMLGVFYLLVRAVRTKRPLQKKYGLLQNAEDGVELDALESDEDDTLYEARSLRRSVTLVTTVTTVTPATPPHRYPGYHCYPG